MSHRFLAPLILGLGFVGCANDGDVAESSADPASLAESLQEDPGVSGRRGIHRIDGVDPSLPSTRDLHALRGIVGGARMVGLGESVHTSGGFHQAQFSTSGTRRRWRRCSGKHRAASQYDVMGYFVV